MPQVPYPHPALPSVDDPAGQAKSTAEDIKHYTSLLAFIYSWQRETLGMLLVAALLQSYVEEGILISTGPPWLREAL